MWVFKITFLPLIKVFPFPLKFFSFSCFSSAILSFKAYLKLNEFLKKITISDEL